MRLLLAVVGCAHAATSGTKAELSHEQLARRTTASGILVRRGIKAELSGDELARRIAQADAFVSRARDNATASCSADYRSTAPGCEQWGGEWCWAAGVSALTLHYKKIPPSDYPQCRGLECQIVQAIDPHGWKCCPSTGGNMCRNDGATLAQVAAEATSWTGVQHRLVGGVLSQPDLDAALTKGPILLLVGQGSPDHVNSLHGCGGGSYYYHDPMTSYGEYMTYSYSEVVSGDDKRWLDTIVHA